MGAIYFADDLRAALDAFNESPRWLIEPYLPAEGIVLLHGKYSIGKSPMIWKIAQSVSEGVDFFGCPISEPGGVLYFEVDQPLALTVERLRLLSPIPSKVYIVGISPFNILNLPPDDAGVFHNLRDNITPKLVIVNTLRKCHPLDDKESSVPSLIYGAWQRLFPGCCFLFVHHDRKSSLVDGRPSPPGDEDFSGAQAWVNDAQIGLHLTPIGAKKDRKVRLEMTKSQLSTTPPPVDLRLGDDGVEWFEIGHDKLRLAFASLDPGIPKMTRYDLVAAGHGVSPATVRRAIGEGDCSRP